MDRQSLILEIEAIIDAQPQKENSKPQIIKDYQGIDGKNGIYFLYNSDNEVIYVGKVGRGESTSFAHRMYLHGTGAHCHKPWFTECRAFRFKAFPNLSEEDLRVIERLMIHKKNQPIYNDGIPTMPSEFDIIFQKIQHK